MKIAHIAPPWIAIPPKHYGGTEVVLYNLIEEQIAQGHDVKLFAPDDAKTSAKLVSFFSQSLLADGIPWPAHLKAFYHFYKAVEYVKEHSFDIVHTHLSSASDMYLFPLTAHLLVPHIMTLHSRFPFDRVGSWIGDTDKLYMEWASSVPMVAISNAARNEVPFRLDFVGVVHHGLPMVKFRPTGEPPADYFAWLGRIVPEKGPHLAIKAAKKAGVPLVLAGTVDAYVPASVDYFESMIKPEIDQQQVKYIGPVDMQQKIELLSRAKGFLNPIEWEEPFGMVMIEAMAVGCPVISFARGAAPEIVAHRKNGFLVQDVDEMADFIPQVEMLQRSVVRAHIEQNFSVRVMAEKYTHLYKKVMMSSRLRSAIVASSQVRRPLMTPSPLRIKTNEPVPVLSPASQTARTALEAEPTS